MSTSSHRGGQGRGLTLTKGTLKLSSWIVKFTFVTGEGVEGEVKGRGREEGREEWGSELVEVTDSCETDRISHTIQ